MVGSHPKSADMCPPPKASTSVLVWGALPVAKRAPICYTMPEMREEGRPCIGRRGFDGRKAPSPVGVVFASPDGGQCVPANVYRGGYCGSGQSVGGWCAGGSGCVRLAELDDAGRDSGPNPGIWHYDGTGLRILGRWTAFAAQSAPRRCCLPSVHWFFWPWGRWRLHPS